MPETPVKPPDRTPTGQLKPGHPKFPGSGRSATNRGRVQRLRDYAKKISERLDLPFQDPAEMLLHIVMTGRDPLEDHIAFAIENGGGESPFSAAKKTHTRPDGSITAVGFVPLELRVDAARLVLPFMLPRLNATELTGENGQTLFKDRSEIGRQMAGDPRVRELFEQITEKAALVAAREDEQAAQGEAE